MKPWRIETITLDENEEVAGVTAVIDEPFLARLEQQVYGGTGAARVVRSERGDTELWVQLDVAELLALWRAQGELDGSPEHDRERIPGCFDSLCLVVYRLMED